MKSTLSLRSGIVIVLLFTLAACSKYNKLLKSTDFDAKYKAAVQYYEDKKYTRALPLLEELITLYRGTEKGEKLYYYYAKTNYELQDYILAAYHFKTFVRTYPNSIYAEECAFYNAYCYYLNSPRYTLDQANTQEAIDEFQLFVNNYPDSKRIEECNQLIDKLRLKQATKQFELAKHYYFIGNYKSAVVAMENSIKDHPASPYNDEALLLIIKSYYLLAEQSIDTKKVERYQLAMDNYAKFTEKYTVSKFLNEATSINDKCKRQINKLSVKS